MKRVLFDAETDGLLDVVTKVHSLVLRDLTTGAMVSCADQPGFTPIRDGLRILAEADFVSGHNIIGYDLRALRKVFPSFRLKEGVKVRDTLLLARLWKADLKGEDTPLIRSGIMPGKLMGSHGLKAWGIRLKEYKGDFGETNDWSVWTPSMQTYCEQDTTVNLKLFRFLAGMAQGGAISPEAVETEHALAQYLAEQEANGFPFDLDGALRLQGELAGRRQELYDALIGTFGRWWKAGEERVPKRTTKKRDGQPCLTMAGCPYTPIELVEFNPASRHQIAERLKVLHGWEPTEFTESGQPKVDDDVLGALPYPEAKLLTEYMVVQKRLGQLAEGDNAWLALAERHPVTGLMHVHGGINQLGTVTHRATHSKPNMAQCPSVKKGKVDGKEVMLWGREATYSTDFRNLWRVPKGWQLLGADASGLELRCLAHYMARYDEGEYVKVITEGDVHSVNRDALGLEGGEGRSKAKTFIYAFLYGSGDHNLGVLVPPDEYVLAQWWSDKPLLKKVKRQLEKREIPWTRANFGAYVQGGELRSRFLKNLPALAALIDAVKLQADKNKYLTVLDGRRIQVRSAHSALNSLLQSAGAVICRRWLYECNGRLTTRFGPQGWGGKWAALAWVHDETQKAVRPEIGAEACDIVVASIQHMTDHFKFRCPLTGEAKLGMTWAETH